MRYYSIGLSSLRSGGVQFAQLGPEPRVLVVPDDKRGADGEELALPALVGDGNDRHTGGNTGLHPDGGVLEDEGVVRRGAEQVERPEVGVREGLGALAVLAGDDELEEVGEAEDGDDELGVGPGRVGHRRALEPALAGPPAQRRQAGDLL